MTDTDSMTTRLTLEEKRQLLRIARESIFYTISRSAPLSVDDDTLTNQLRKKAGAFVSLHIEDQLRGCIGSIYDHEALYKTVLDMAVKAATHDPRFPALSATEIPHTEIEISILSPLKPIDSADVVVGHHGLLLAHGSRRGLLLPQVPVQYGWTRIQFLDALSRKAGLAPSAWRADEAQLQAFTADVFSDGSLDDEHGEE